MNNKRPHHHHTVHACKAVRRRFFFRHVEVVPLCVCRLVEVIHLLLDLLQLQVELSKLVLVHFHEEVTAAVGQFTALLFF